MSQRNRLLLIFCFSFAVFLTFQSTPVFADPDSFYHAGAARMVTQGRLVIDQFPFLPFSILTEKYIDHHFLYHVVLAPFSFANPPLGIKIATAFFGALFVTLFSRILFFLRVPYPELFILLLLTNRPFLFRADLAKASTFSLLFLMTGLFALLRKRWFFVFLTAFLYIWAYDGWILFLGVVGVYWMAHSFGEMVYEKRRLSISLFFQTLFSREETRAPLTVLTGMIGGIVINPFFPKNLSFYYDHIVKIGFVGYKNIIGVGGEWYGYHPALFLGNNAILLVGVILALVVYIASLKHQGTNALISLFLAIVFVVATFKSQRNVEYAVPFLVLFTAYSLRLLSGAWLKKKFFEYVKKPRWLLFFYGAAFAVVFSITKDVMLLRKQLANGFRLDYLQEESQWISSHISKDEIIFHSNWDEFPALFYYNPSNYYIAGLDPSFMYAYNKEKYFLWRDITQGKVAENLQKIIKQEFGSTTVLASKNHQPLQRNLELNGFTLVYDGRDARIYQGNSQ